jgi:hypothetical protein
VNYYADTIFSFSRGDLVDRPPDLLDLRGKAIKTINSSLADPNRGADDFGVAAVFCMSIMESIYGDTAAYGVHSSSLFPFNLSLIVESESLRHVSKVRSTQLSSQDMSIELQLPRHSLGSYTNISISDWPSPDGDTTRRSAESRTGRLDRANDHVAGLQPRQDPQIHGVFRPEH